jgi:hypothetical protein
MAEKLGVDKAGQQIKIPLRDTGEQFRPDKLTSAQMDTLVLDVNNYVTKHWDDKSDDEIPLVTKIGLRQMTKAAMAFVEKPTKELGKKVDKGSFGGYLSGRGSGPSDFSPEETEKLKVGLKEHLVKNWDTFTFITHKMIRDLSGNALKEGDIKRAKQQKP